METTFNSPEFAPLRSQIQEVVLALRAHPLDRKLRTRRDDLMRVAARAQGVDFAPGGWLRGQATPEESRRIIALRAKRVG